MIVTIAKVAHFDQFLETLSTKAAEKRKQHGSTGSYVFRDPDDPSRVWVFFDWHIEDYQRFLSDPEIPAIARELALRDPPVKADPRRPVRLMTGPIAAAQQFAGQAPPDPSAPDSATCTRDVPWETHRRGEQNATVDALTADADVTGGR